MREVASITSQDPDMPELCIMLDDERPGELLIFQEGDCIILDEYNTFGLLEWLQAEFIEDYET